MTTEKAIPDPAEKGTTVHRGGYGEPAFQLMMKIARNGGTLSAGEGRRIIDYYEERQEVLLHTLGVLLNMDTTAEHLKDEAATIEALFPGKAEETVHELREWGAFLEGVTLRQAIKSGWLSTLAPKSPVITRASENEKEK